MDRVYDRHGALTKQEAAEVVDALLHSMKKALLHGRPVRIQNFGVFEVVSRRGRAGINPADGQPLFIPPHRGLQFRPSKLMRQEVEQPEPEAAPGLGLPSRGRRLILDGADEAPST